MNTYSAFRKVSVGGIVLALFVGAHIHAAPAGCSAEILLIESGKTLPIPGKPQINEDTLLTLQPSEPLQVRAFIRNLGEAESMEVVFEGHGVTISPRSPVKFSLGKGETKELSLTARIPAGTRCQQAQTHIRMHATSPTSSGTVLNCGSVVKYFTCAGS